MYRIQNREPQAPSQLTPHLPHGFDTVLAKALAKDREQRYQSAGEFIAALQQVMAEYEPDHPLGYRAKTGSRRIPGGRHTAWLSLAGLILVGLIAGYHYTVRWVQDNDSFQNTQVTGYMDIVSEPGGAIVLLNGNQFRGVTPVRIEVPPGHYPLVIRKAGYHDIDLSVEVESAVEIPLHVSLTRK